jgi:hypothetical protein
MGRVTNSCNNLGFAGVISRTDRLIEISINHPAPSFATLAAAINRLRGYLPRLDSNWLGRKPFGRVSVAPDQPQVAETDPRDGQLVLLIAGGDIEGADC